MKAGRASGMIALAVLFVIACTISIRAGSVSLGLGAVWDALLGRGDPTTVTIVRDLRLPRAAAAALVGAALATSGAAFQALLRNPLAEPYVLGISGGAALGAVAAIVLGLLLPVPGAVSVAAFLGAVITIALVLRIALGVGPTLDTRVLLLSGVVVGAFANAGIFLMLSVADVNSYRSATAWMMGSLSGTTWGGDVALAVQLVPGLAVLLLLARPLNAMAIGEETAAYLGVSVERTKWLAYGAASLLAAASVATAGVVGFVGLIIPHAVRLMWGSDYRVVIPASALLGATFLLLTDVAARTLAAPSELPLGAVTAVIGVPVFVALLRRKA
ncbi:MAG TPA: iron ABC transporter permease [Gemmatimonadaceae bacterium]|nr:iron ABC transporter permease [Gemmatimonadaceae bacterium]